MHHGHLHAAPHQPVGGFQAEQAAADDHRMPVAGGGVDHGLGIGDIAVGDDARQVAPRHRQDERVRPGGQQQPVVGGFAAVVGPHQALDAVDLRHLAAGVQGDALLRIPAERVEDDLVQRLLSRQHRAEQDAVVVGVRLGAEDRDVVEPGRDLQQLFQRAHAGHAVAHHHEFHRFHSVLLALSALIQCAHQATFSTWLWRM